MQRIYLDHASATPLDDRVREAMEPYFKEHFGNAGMKHKEGRDAKAALEASRKTVAECIGARPEEVVFTSGGTESNMLSFVGVLSHYAKEVGFEKLHTIASVLEHSSVRDLVAYFNDYGVKNDYLGVNANGIIDLDECTRLLKENTALVSVMYANETIGTIQPLAQIAGLLRAYSKERADGAVSPIFHTDAAQAALFLDLDVERLGVDLMSINGPKVYGPKGIGALYVKNGIQLDSFYRMGQEGGRRGGTENIPAIVGFAKALEIAQAERQKTAQRIGALRDYFIEQLEARINGLIVNGDRKERLPNNAHVSIPGANHEFLMVALDEKGIACSTKSACLTATKTASSILTAMGSPEESGLRFSLGRHTTKEEVDRTVAAFGEILKSSCFRQ